MTGPYRNGHGFEPPRPWFIRRWLSAAGEYALSETAFGYLAIGLGWALVICWFGACYSCSDDYGRACATACGTNGGVVLEYESWGADTLDGQACTCVTSDGWITSYDGRWEITRRTQK